MTRPDDFGLMQTRDFARIQELCDRLERAWKEFDSSKREVDLEPLLQAAGPELRLAALYEFIKTEMPLRCERGLDWDLDYYVQRFPELRGPQELSLGLIAEEGLVRKKYGLEVSLAGFQRRFPQQFPELEKLLRQDKDSAMPSGPSPKLEIRPAWQAPRAGAQVGGEPKVAPPASDSSYGTIAPHAAAVLHGQTSCPWPRALPDPASPLARPKPAGGPVDVSGASLVHSSTSIPAGTPRERRDCGEASAFFAKLRPGIAIRNLTLLRKVGEGSYADVWKVLDTEGGVEKAIRIIKTPLKSEEARAELKALASYKNLRHPFLLHTDSAFEVEQQLIIVMELVEGGSLRDRLKDLRRGGEKGMAPCPLLGYISEVAQVLDYLHGKNILHRDIKPDNILLGKERYHVKVADLGLVKLAQANADTSTLAGTPAYIAPEVWLEQGCYGASDQYSLAATYAELRQGEIASRGGVPCLKPGLLGAEEYKVVQLALSRDRHERYPSCAALVKALEAAVRRDANPPPRWPWPDWCRRLAPWVLLTVAAFGSWGIVSCDGQPTLSKAPVATPVPRNPVKEEEFDPNKFTMTP